MYDLDLPEIGEALLRAKNRGTKIFILIHQGLLFPKDDNGQSEPINPVVKAMIDGGYDVRVLRGFVENGSQHNKFAILDDSLLIGGSYNWTENSENLHFDNVMFESNLELIGGYKAYWDWMWKASWSVREGIEAGEKGREPELSPASPPAYQGGGILFSGQYFPLYAFSPGGGVREHLVRAIIHSNQSIEIAMFAFYDFRTASALVWAKEKKKVNVRVLLDKNQAAQSPILNYLLKRGVNVKLLAGPTGEGTHDRMHNKFAIFDKVFLINGSYNYSPNAEKKSFENVYFTGDMSDVGGFSLYFERMWRK
ncbi:MAG: hypothetical protein HY400_06780, partial [Elusimicrobia bacterium]|nr:hypothetical protein [Elusimicrobiota bacterium]